MAATAISICNTALGRVGIKAFISSLLEETPEAEVCNAFYETVRDTALASAPWPFAKKRAVLAELEGVEREGWLYCYAKPSDCLSPREIWSGYRNPRADQKIRFELYANDTGSGEIICTDQEEAELIYTMRITNPAAFHPLFVDALSWKLAGEIAMPLSVRPDLRENAIKEWERAKLGAFQAAKNEEHEPIQESIFITERE